MEVHADGGGDRAHRHVTPNGQGHETAFAQIAVRGARCAVRCRPRDPFRHRRRAAGRRARGARARCRPVARRSWNRRRRWSRRPAALAAHLLEADEADVEPPAEGRFRGARARPTARSPGPSWRRRADPRGLPAGMEPGLASAGRFRRASSSFPFGAHVAVVEVDTETGDVRLVRHVAVDDCGRILNPMLVEGQVHGGLAQGIAQALYEEVRYDELGNPIDRHPHDLCDARRRPSSPGSRPRTPRPRRPRTRWAPRGSANPPASGRRRPCRTPPWTRSAPRRTPSGPAALPRAGASRRSRRARL